MNKMDCNTKFVNLINQRNRVKMTPYQACQRYLWSQEVKKVCLDCFQAFIKDEPSLWLQRRGNFFAFVFRSTDFSEISKKCLGGDQRVGSIKGRCGRLGRCGSKGHSKPYLPFWPAEITPNIFFRWNVLDNIFLCPPPQPISLVPTKAGMQPLFI